MAYQVTGNEYLSLPTIRESDGAVEGITFLYMQAKGLLEVRGDSGLLCPYLTVSGERKPMTLAWSRAHSWIPTCHAAVGTVDFQCTYVAPIGERALAIRLQAHNRGTDALQVRVGMDGRWDRTLHEINETGELATGREVIRSGWNGMFVWQQRPGMPLFAMAPCLFDGQPFSEIDQGADWAQDGFGYDLGKTVTLAAGESATLDVFWGVGYETVSAATSAKELLRQGV